MKRFIKRSTMNVLLPLMALLLNAPTYGQSGISSDGREFFLGYVNPSVLRQISSTVSFTPDLATAVYITSQTDNSVDISYYDAGGTPTKGSTLNLKAGTSATFLPDMSSFGESNLNGESVEYRSLHITARAPISVTFVSTGACSGGSYLALPVSCWGKKYVVQSYKDNPNGNGGMINQLSSRGFFQVCASENGTQVTITASTNTAGGHGGSTANPQPFSVSLNRGQIYTVYSAGVDQSADLTGSLVSANKPIAVISGHENAFPTAGGDDVTLTDARDYMIEQIIPTECWDSAGIFTIPLLDGTPSTAAGGGDEICVVTMPSNGNGVQYMNGSVTNVLSVPSYSSTNFASTTVALGFNDLHGKPFGVMQYDQSMQVNPPDPAPAMLSAIPKSRWKSEYSFTYPSTTNNTHSMYLLLVAPRADWNGQKILVSRNGSPAASLIASGFAVKRTYNSLPGDSSVIGAVLVVNGMGTYHIFDVAPAANPSLHSTFGAAVQSVIVDGNQWPGGRTTFPDVPVEFANPLGMQYGEFGLPKGQLGATVANLCGKWSICISDSGVAGSGIRYVEILNYPDNAYASSLPISHNVKLDADVDPLGKGEIILPGTDGTYCFNVNVVNPTDTAVAVIRAYDNSGASIVINLTASTAISSASSGSLAKRTASAFTYGTHAVDSLICGALNITNPIIAAGKAFVIDSIKLQEDTTHFTISGALGAFPLVVDQGNTLSIPVCFRADDTSSFHANLKVYSECGASFTFAFDGKGAAPILRADDAIFEPTDSGGSSCDTIPLRNVGTLPLVIEPGSLLSDTTNFSFSPAFVSRLPLSIPAGGSENAIVCFSPADHNPHTAMITWHTNMSESSALLAHAKKASKLIGRGSDLGVSFSPTTLAFVVDSTQQAPSAKMKIFVANHGSAKSIMVSAMQIVGTDSAEFAITNSQSGAHSGFTILTGDSSWFEISFQPDVTKPYPSRYLMRDADLVCTFIPEGSSSSSASVIAPMTGTFDSFAGVPGQSANAAEVHAYFSGNVLIVDQSGNAGGRSISYRLYDLLGRLISSHDVDGSTYGSQAFPVGDIPAGVYLLAINDGMSMRNTLVRK